MRNTITQRVRRGATLLDQEQPDWFEEIDTARLNVASDVNCPLGQLHGNFWTGCSILDITVLSAARYGFIASLWSVFTGRYRSQSAWLTAAWLTEIRARRQAVATANGHAESYLVSSIE